MNKIIMDKFCVSCSVLDVFDCEDCPFYKAMTEHFCNYLSLEYDEEGEDDAED